MLTRIEAQIAGSDTYLIPEFEPQGVMNLTFGQSAITPGQKVPQAGKSSSQPSEFPVSGLMCTAGAVTSDIVHGRGIPIGLGKSGGVDEPRYAECPARAH